MPLLLLYFSPRNALPFSFFSYNPVCSPSLYLKTSYCPKSTYDHSRVTPLCNICPWLWHFSFPPYMIVFIYTVYSLCQLSVLDILFIFCFPWCCAHSKCSVHVCCMTKGLQIVVEEWHSYVRIGGTVPRGGMPSTPDLGMTDGKSRMGDSECCLWSNSHQILQQ